MQFCALGRRFVLAATVPAVAVTAEGAPDQSIDEFAECV